ncbi:MAG TPA: hypothetical protein VGC15_07085 [Acetobacteraceae bacterium]
MRKVLLTCVALLSLPVGPVLAQQAIPNGSAVDIPAPAGPSSVGVTPSANALPDTGTVSGGGMTGLRPMRGQPKQAVGMNHFTHKPPPTPARSNGKRRGSPANHTSAISNDGVNAPRPGSGAAGASTSGTAARFTTTGAM